MVHKFLQKLVSLRHIVINTSDSKVVVPVGGTVGGTVVVGGSVAVTHIQYTHIGLG